MRATLLATAAAILLAQPAFADFKLGWAGPLTGGSAAVGQQNLNGVKQAVEDINAAGGVLGETIDLQVSDDAGEPKQAVSVANLVIGNGAKFVVGHQNSGASIPASEVYEEAGVLEVTPASTNPKFTDRGLWNVFRTCGRDDQQGTVAGAYLAKTFAGKRVFLINDKTTYGKGLADEVKKAMNAAGLKEVAYEGINAGEKDYSALVSKIKAAKADAVYFGGIYTEAGLIRRQLTDQGVAAPLMGGDAILSSEFSAIAGPGGEGTMITFSPDARKNPAAAPILERFKAKNIDPEGFTLYGYAAVQVIAEAVKAAGKPDAKLAAEKLHGGLTVNTVVGPLAYDKKGDITRLDFVFYKVVDGKFVEQPAAQ